MKTNNFNSSIPVLDRVFFIMMGMIVFSSFSSTLCQSVLHFPMTLPEPFFVVFVLILRKYLLPANIDKRIFSYLLLALLSLIIISQIIGKYSFYSVLSSSRGYLYLFLFYSVFVKKNKLRLEELLYISFGSLLGWSIACIMAFGVILRSPNASIETYGNVIAVALFISITILKKKWWLFTFGIGLLIIISFMSGIRRVIPIIIVACAFSLFCYFLQSAKSKLRMIPILLLLIVPFFYIIPAIGEYAEKNTPSLYYRLFTKSEQLINGEISESDQARKLIIVNFQENLIDFMMPRGMVSNQYTNDKGTGAFMDFPFMALSYIFSFPLALLFVIYFLTKSFQCFFYYRLTLEESAGVYSISSIIMLLLLFIEGTFLVHPYTTPFTGMCLGSIAYYGRKYIRIKHVHQIIN